MAVWPGIGRIVEAVASNRRVLLMLSVSSVVAGFYRLLVQPTLPSYRLLDAGLVGLLYLWVWSRWRGPGRGYRQVKKIRFLLFIVLAAFFYRAVWSLTSPLPLGADTEFYLKLTLDTASDPVKLVFLGRAYLEPVPIAIFAFFYRLGIPASWIPRVIIPVLSSLSLLPFFLLTRSIRDEETAQIATILLAFSTLQLRLVLDLFRQVVSFLFMLFALYFVRGEKSVYPARTFAFAMLSLLSHAAGFVIFVIASALSLMFRGDRRVLKNLGYTLVTILILAAAIGPFMYWASWMRSPALFKLQGISERGHLLFEVILWALPLEIVALRSLLSAARKDYALALALSIIGLVFLSLLNVLNFWSAADRWALALDIPLAVLSADTIRRSTKPLAALSLSALWLAIDGLSFGFINFDPSRWPNRTWPD